jgi:formate dehydrogenase alpha subunit
MASERTEPTKTICPYCGVGCGVAVQQSEDGDVTFRPWPDAPVNEGSVCIKGGAATEIVDNRERLDTPLVRVDGELQETTWADALAYVEEEYERIRAEHGPDGMGFFASSQVTNEANYLFQRLARSYGTNNIDNCARLCHSSTVVALSESLGRGAMTNSLEDLMEADVYWMQGANPAENHVIAHSKYFQEAVDDGTTLIQVDPHENETTADADIHLRVKPGTDIALLNAVLATIVDNEWYDETFVAERTEGFDALVDSLDGIDRAAMAETAGVPLDAIETAAETLATAEKAAIFTGMGMSQHTSGTDNVRALIDLALITGNLGEPGTGVNPLRGQNNVQGASDVGALPNVLPGYRPVTDDDARAAAAVAWGVEDLPAEPGLTNVEITQSLGDRIRGLHVMGENPAVSEPNANEAVDHLRELDFLCVQDIFLTETAKLADVVLPATSWAESEGTVTNTDRRVQRMRAGAKVPGDSRHDWEIVAEIGDRVLDTDWDFATTEDVFEELREVCPIYHGMTHDRLGRTGLQWPCVDEDDDGTQYLYRDSFDTDNGLGKIRPVDHQPPRECTDGSYPFVLCTGRIEEHFNSGAMTTRSETLTRVVPENFVEIHPDDATDLGIEDGETVLVSTERGEIRLTADVTDGVKLGVIWSTFHFPDAPINKLTNDSLDPEAKIPEYKAAAGRIAADVRPADSNE